jgi:uncharacterized protein YkwD
MRTIICLAALLCLFSLPLWRDIPSAEAAARSPRQTTAQPGVDAARLEKKIHERINLERKKAGLPSLVWNQKLQGIARNFSRDMATRNFFSHYSPEGQNFTSRYQQNGFDCAVGTGRRATSLGGENIAQSTLYSSYGHKNGKRFYNWLKEEQIASGVVRQWMNSAGHRRNILSRDFRQEGIGVHLGQDGMVLVTENFC